MPRCPLKASAAWSAAAKPSDRPRRRRKPEVAEFLPDLTLARMRDLTAHEIARSVHAHPTLGEAVKEASTASSVR